MSDAAVERSRERLRAAAEGHPTPAALEAALERARAQVEELAQAAAEFQATIPGRIDAAVRESLREQVEPAGRNLAEIRGLINQLIGRLERVEGDLLAERHARVDDLALLVDLITFGWKSIEARLGKLESSLEHGETFGAVPARLRLRPDRLVKTR